MVPSAKLQQFQVAEPGHKKQFQTQLANQFAILQALLNDVNMEENQISEALSITVSKACASSYDSEHKYGSWRMPRFGRPTQTSQTG